MDLSRLRQINEQKALEASEQLKHDQLLLDTARTQEIIVRSFAAMRDFLENRVGKTEVVNQLTEIGTPDALRVVEALNSLHDTIKTHENTDLSEITAVMRDLLQEAKQIPKSHNDIEIPKPIDNSKQLGELIKAIGSLEKAVKAQELSVEAPVVNVPETNVNVEAPDLNPIKDSITDTSKDVVQAVKGIKIPELNTDPVEKLLKKTNKLLEELPELMPTGGGGGGSSWVATDSNGTPMPIELNPDGSVPVGTANFETRFRVDSGTPTLYYSAKAVLGSADSDPVWQIKSIDTSTGANKYWPEITGTPSDAFSFIWDNREGYTYS